MPTQSSSVIQALKEIAAKEVDLAAEALALSMKTAEDEQSKYAMLCQYRADYLKNQNHLMETGMGAEVYRNFQNFFKKLDQAVSAQAEAVEFAKQQVNIQRNLWQESQRKKLSYGVLTQRADSRELKVQQKRDQNAMDEFAMRISGVKRAPASRKLGESNQH